MKRFHISNYVSFRLNSVAEVTNIYVGGGGLVRVRVCHKNTHIQPLIFQVQCVYVF